MNQFILWQTVFVVWREALEAILIIAILYSFLVKTNLKALPSMWRGVFAGIILSFAMALVILGAAKWLAGNAQVVFQVSVLLLSCGLMTQMVFWMRRHAKSLKRDVESNLKLALEQPSYIGVASIAALSVGREGSEAVIYIYGLGLEKSASLSSMLVSVSLGMIFAGAMFYFISKGLKHLKTQVFFDLTSAVLLISAAGLGASAIGKLVAENIISGIIEPMWDISKWLDSEGSIVAVIKAIFGYNPRPTLSEVLFYAGFWLLIVIARKKNLLII